MEGLLHRTLRNGWTIRHRRAFSHGRARFTAGFSFADRVGNFKANTIIVIHLVRLKVFHGSGGGLGGHKLNKTVKVVSFIRLGREMRRERKERR